ncbi:hypothetical protein ACVWXM_002358 [Bradyrhizobium sp. GM7.3]
MIYTGISIVFFLLPFDLVDRRALSSTDAGLAFLPFTLGVGLLSSVFGGLADKIGTRTMLIAGPAGAALAYVWLALGHKESLMLGVIVPMTLLGLSFAVLVTPLTASVMSSVDQTDEGLASGINNAASRVAQLARCSTSRRCRVFRLRLRGRSRRSRRDLDLRSFYSRNNRHARRHESGRLGRRLDPWNSTRFDIGLPDALKFTEAAIRSGVSRSRLRRTRRWNTSCPEAGLSRCSRRREPLTLAP